ncbi:hypothetical protein [Caballeronia sp. KNU42]
MDELWQVHFVPPVVLVGVVRGLGVPTSEGTNPVSVVRAGDEFWVMSGGLVMGETPGFPDKLLWLPVRKMKADETVKAFGSFDEVSAFLEGLRAGARCSVRIRSVAEF